MKIEKNEKTENLVEEMSKKLSNMGFAMDCGTEAAQEFTLFACALHYAIEGRGALFSSGGSVSNTNFFGGEPIRFKDALTMRKVMRSSGWAQTSRNCWKPRLKEV